MATYTVKAGDTKGKLKQLFGIDYNYSGYRSKDPNKLFAGEVLNVPDHTPALNFQPQSPISGTYLDLSKISSGVKPVNIPDPVLPPVQQTPFVAPMAPSVTTGAQQTANVPSQQQSQVNPVTAAKTSTQQKSEEQTLQEDIAALEQQIAGAGTQKTQGYTDSKVYDDVQKLQVMKEKLAQVQDQLYTAQDAPVSIDANAKSALRGNQATYAAYNQMTAPQLEQNAVDTLAKSREYGRLGSAIGNYAEAINANIALVDQRVNAETEQKKVLLESKQKRLEAIQKRNVDIYTEAQKLLLEDRKQQNAIELQNLKGNQELKTATISKLLESGLIDYTQLPSLLNLDTPQLLAFQQSATSSASWLSFEEQRAVNLPKDKFEIWQKYHGLDEASQKEFKTRKPASEKTQLSIETIDNMLGNTVGLNSRVGFNQRAFNPMNWGAANTFVTDAKNLVAVLTSDALLNLKSAGGALGAISEKELDLLQSSASNLGIDTTSGTSNLPEPVFRERLKKVKEHSQRLYLSLQISESEYISRSYDKATQEEIQDIYTDYKAGTLTAPSNQTHSSTIAPIPTARTQPPAIRNNNPGNIKMSDFTKTFQGVVGYDPNAALDGGHFLKFATAEDGFSAQKRLLKSSVYSNLTVNDALKKWSNFDFKQLPGYDASIAPKLASRKVATLSDTELDALIRAMAKKEGFFNT